MADQVSDGGTKHTEAVMNPGGEITLAGEKYWFPRLPVGWIPVVRRRLKEGTGNPFIAAQEAIAAANWKPQDRKAMLSAAAEASSQKAASDEQVYGFLADPEGLAFVVHWNLTREGKHEGLKVETVESAILGMDHAEFYGFMMQIKDFAGLSALEALEKNSGEGTTDEAD